MACASFRSSSSSVNSEEGGPHCDHGLCDLKTSMSLENPERRYWKCPRWSEDGACSYFLWHEPPYEGHVRDVLLEIIRKHNYFKGKLATTERECSKLADGSRNATEELEAKKRTIVRLEDELERNLDYVGDLELQLEEKVQSLGVLKVENSVLKKSVKETEFRLWCWVFAMVLCVCFMFVNNQFFKSGGSSELLYMLK